MRISDWSSDVCSSDLRAAANVDQIGIRDPEADGQGVGRKRDVLISVFPGKRIWRAAVDGSREQHAKRSVGGRRQGRKADRRGRHHGPLHALLPQAAKRSEEHTSELQSLMRISYAVFCLKKKKHQTNNNKQVKQLQTIHR